MSLSKGDTKLLRVLGKFSIWVFSACSEFCKPVLISQTRCQASGAAESLNMVKSKLERPTNQGDVACSPLSKSDPKLSECESPKRETHAPNLLINVHVCLIGNEILTIPCPRRCPQRKALIQDFTKSGSGAAGPESDPRATKSTTFARGLFQPFNITPG